MYKPYSIMTPPFDPTSGGIRAMWGLYGWLLAKGQIAYVNAKFTDPNFIGIYPEIYHGNDMGANTIVRYILQTPGIMSSYGVPSPTTEEFKNNPIYKNDRFYIFSKIYNTFGVDDNHILFLPIINTHLFKDQQEVRNKTCYLVGKGINQNKHPLGSIELTREFATDQQALADLLCETKVLYCYDPMSAIMEISRLCGARVIYLGSHSKEELAKYEPGMNGITYHSEPEVELDTEAFRKHYLNMKDEFSIKLDIFIQETQK